METKKCTICGKEQPIENFHKNRKTKDGLQYHCKECQKEYERRRKLRKLTGGSELNKVYTNQELAKFTPRELLAELKARGYVWEKMYAPRIEIKYEKI